MNTKSLSDIIDDVIHNPVATMRHTLRYLRNGLDNRFDFVDPSNPFIALLESSAQHSSAAVLACEAEVRKAYPIIANSPEELYHHLTDKDYIDRFAYPTKAKISFTLLESEVRRKMVLDPLTGYRKLVMPRNTTVEISGYTFTLLHPIEIRELLHGDLFVVYDVTEKHPLQELSTNVIDLYYSSSKEGRFITFTAEMLQVKVTAYKETITPSTNIRVKRTLQDEYHYTRAYVRNSSNRWVEIPTTHSAYYYDPGTVTAVIKVIGKEISITIPDYYVLSEMVMGEVRFDVFETKGPMNVDLGTYSLDEYSTAFHPLDPLDRTLYTEALKNLSTFHTFSNDLVNGGRLPLSFQELRSRVINHTTGPKEKPITPDQIETTLIDNGYEIIKRIDNVTNRVFVASRSLPKPRNEKLITATSLGMQAVIFTIQDILHTGTVIDNIDSVTIDPKTMFRYRNGLLEFVTDTEVEAIKGLPKDQVALKVNSEEFFFSPFHYVVDLTDESKHDIRAYYLTEPTALNKVFIAENSTTFMSATVDSYSLTYDDRGYRLRVATKSNDYFRSLNNHEVHAQLAFMPSNHGTRTYVNAELIGRSDQDEYIFEFLLESTFKVTKNNAIEFNNFTMGSGVVRPYESLLEGEFDLFFATSATVGGEWKPGLVEDLLGKHILPIRIAGISHEKIRLRFGHALDNLWTQYRSIGTTQTFEVYEEDVPAVYDQNVLDMKIVNGKVEIEIEHKKGDIKYDENGEIIYASRKGDIKHEHGRPVVLSPRKIGHQVELLLMDGTYRFSNDPIAIAYETEVAGMLTKWISSDLDAIKPSLLEETRIFFHPRTTTGRIPIIFNNAGTTEIPASQSLTIDLYVSEVVERDIPLRDQLKLRTIEVVSNYFLNPVIAKSELTNLLNAVYEDQVIDIAVRGLGGLENDFDVVTIVNKTDRLSIGKKLTARPDDVLLVEEDINVNFVRHHPKQR